MVEVMLYDLGLGLKTSVTSALVSLELSILESISHVRIPTTLPEERLQEDRPGAVFDVSAPTPVILDVLSH